MKLTHCQRRVLDFLTAMQQQSPRSQISSRVLASTLSMSRRTVQASLQRLNELEIVATWGGSHLETASHQVLDPGAISNPPPGAISAPLVPLPPGAISAPRPGEVHANREIAVGRIKETRAALTHSPREADLCKTRESASEVAWIRAQLEAFPFCFGPMRRDDPTPARLAGLLQSLGGQPPQLRAYLEDLTKRALRYPIHHAGALWQFAREGGLETWLLRQYRKPMRQAATVFRVRAAPEPVSTSCSREEEIGHVEEMLARYRDSFPDGHPEIEKLAQQLAALQQPRSMAAGGHR